MYMNSSRNVNRTQILVQILSELEWLNVSSPVQCWKAGVQFQQSMCCLNQRRACADSQALLARWDLVLSTIALSMNPSKCPHKRLFIYLLK